MSEHGPNMSQHKALEPTPSRSLQKGATDIDDERLGLHSFSTACPQLTRFLPQDRPRERDIGEGVLLYYWMCWDLTRLGPKARQIYEYTHTHMCIPMDPVVIP